MTKLNNSSFKIQSQITQVIVLAHTILQAMGLNVAEKVPIQNLVDIVLFAIQPM